MYAHLLHINNKGSWCASFGGEGTPPPVLPHQQQGLSGSSTSTTRDRVCFLRGRGDSPPMFSPAILRRHPGPPQAPEPQASTSNRFNHYYKNIGFRQFRHCRSLLGACVKDPKVLLIYLGLPFPHLHPSLLGLRTISPRTS